MILYLDTSAMVKLSVEESMSSDVVEAVEEAEAVATSLPIAHCVASLICEAEMDLAWMSPTGARDVAFDFAEFLFESIQTGLNRLLLCDVGCRHSVQESLVGDSCFAR